jgi:hypothetical protein
MRQISKDYLVDQVIKVKEIAVKEDFVSICEYPLLKIVNVEIGYFSSKGTILDKTNYTVSGSNYDLLMTNLNAVSTEKAIREVREREIWRIIDIIRGESSSN